jgi:hypothetical protein
MYFNFPLVYICVSRLACAISKTDQLYEEYFDDHGVDIDLSQLLLFFLSLCVSITITITAVFSFFSFFCSFFLTLKKKAHARQNQNKVNIFSTMKNISACDISDWVKDINIG